MKRLKRPKPDRIVMSLGGSLVSVHNKVNSNFLAKFNYFVRDLLSERPNRQIFIVVGGGSVARHYRDAIKRVIGRALTNDDLDWLGIHATRLNAHALRTIFRDLAEPFILKHYDFFRKVSKPIVIGAGWKPGWSTDYCAMMVARDYKVKTVLNLSNIAQYYDKDPAKYSDAKPFKKISWQKFLIRNGSEWVPGMNSPFDPVASKKAAELGCRVIIMKGDDLENLGKYFRGEKFVGTVIE